MTSAEDDGENVTGKTVKRKTRQPSRDGDGDKGETLSSTAARTGTGAFLAFCRELRADSVIDVDDFSSLPLSFSFLFSASRRLYRPFRCTAERAA